MTTKLQAKFDGKVLIPQGPVDFPTDELIELDARTIPKNEAKPPLQALLEAAKQFPPVPDSPGDAAAQHDHYLYGTTKRENP